MTTASIYISRLRAVIARCLALVFLPCSLAAQERLLIDGKVFTADPRHPCAEALALRGRKIVAVGNESEVVARLGNLPEIIDLNGKTLLPSLGITSWLDPSVNAEILATYLDLAAEGRLTAHVAAFVVLNPIPIGLIPMKQTHLPLSAL